MKRVSNCDLCGSKDSRVIFVEDGVSILKCKNCGLVYSSTVPERIFEREESAEEISRSTKREKIHIYLSVLQDVKIKMRNGKLLDVGCRVGDFLIEAKNYGFDVVGIEISEKFASYARARGLNVISGMLKEAKFLSGSFDVVTYLMVLEHIPTPSEELREAYRILKDNGLLILEIPNFRFNSIKAKIFSFLRLKAGLMPLNHLFHYTKETICKMLEKNGFQIETLKAKCSIEGREGTFLAKIYLFLSPIFEVIPLKWILCNDLVVFARKLPR
jgi:2-polyprenyl-3-methyl-5-hydroxy-6-metoxy-1,4-benzoquinol methylase